MEFTTNKTEENKIENQTVNTQPAVPQTKKMSLSDQVIQTSKNVEDTRKANIEKYGIELDPIEYDALATEMDRAQSAEDANAIKYKYAAAKQYSKTMNVPMDRALSEVDEYSQALFAKVPQMKEYDKFKYTKSWYEAIADSFMIGENGVKMSDLGLQLMDAEEKGDTERVKAIMELYDAYEADNNDRADNVPRNFFVGAGKFAAEMIPFTGRAMALSLIPKAGPALGFAFSATQAEGRTYMDLRRDGCSRELAAKISVIDGCIEGAIEQAMGVVKIGKGAVSKATGKQVSKAINDKIIQKAVGNIRGGGVYKVMADTAMRVVGQGIDEGIEEVLQDGTNLMARYIASAAEDYDLDITAGEVAKTLKESFAGGFAGSILLGAPSTAIHVGTDVKDIKALKATAEAIPSKETFVKVVKQAEEQREKEGKNTIFAEMDETTKSEVISNIWDNVNKNKQKKSEMTAKELTEVYGAEENMEVFADVDEEGNEIEDKVIPQEYRTQEGRLYSTNEMTGENKGQFKIGDGSQDNGKVYGYINYSIDEDTNTVTIENFKTTVERGNLRNEMFMEFAKQNSGYEIKWDPKGKYAREIKDNLVSLNPYGRNAGLSYFKVGEDISKQEQEDSYTRSKILSQIAQHMDVKADERAPMLAVFEQIAIHNGMSVSDMFYGVFDGNVFGKISQNTTMLQADQAGAIRGGIRVENIMGSIKATIYAAENADFSTWNHELAHLYRSMMQGEELAEAEKAFGVKNGNWTRQNEEDFAVGLEEYLRSGKVKSGALNEMYQKIVEFMARVYNGLKDALIKLSPEMEQFFDKIINSGNEVWQKAQEAVKNADENRSVAADIVEEKKAEIVKDNKELQPKKKTDETIAEGMNAKRKTETVAESEIEKNTTLSKENKNKAEEVISDNELTVEEKADAVEKIAAEQLQEDRKKSLRDGGNEFSDEDVIDLFQLVGPMGRANLAKELAYNADKAAIELSMEGYSNAEILARTGRVIVNGQIWYDTKDGDFFKETDLVNSFTTLNEKMKSAYEAAKTVRESFDFDVAKAAAMTMEMAAREIEKTLTELNSKYGTIGKLYNAAELYKAAPYLKDKKIEFTCNAKDLHVSRCFNDRVVFNFFGIQDMASVMNELKKVLNAYIVANEKGKELPAEGIAHLFLKEQINNPINKEIIQNIAGVKVAEFFQGSKQEEEVRKQYENTDKWMKAPNGTDTRLTEKQWLQVRTENFKNWFGDWEKDPENASKVVDENGEPLVVYHGTPHYGFETFRSESYFTKNKDYAEVYKNKNIGNATEHGIYSIFLNIKNPFDTRNKTDKKIFYDEFYQQWGNGADLVNGLPDWTDASDLIEFIKDKGYDGVYVDEGVTQGKNGLEEAGFSYIPVESNQIKSATDNNGDFNTDNESILFQAVFHGSPHIIRRPGGEVVRDEELGFDHSKMGSGEGVQAFGWGTYVTEVEGIAKDYASKLSSMPYTEEETKRLAAIDEIYSAPNRIAMSIESKKDFVKHRKTDLRNLDNGKYEARILKNIKEFTKELKAAKKDKDEDNIKFYEGLIATSEEDLNQKKKEYLRKEFQNDIDKALEEIADLKKKHKEAEKKLIKEIDSLKAEIEDIRNAAKARPAENVYTLDIPDDTGSNYLEWDKPIGIKQYRAILKQAKEEHLENFVGYIIEDAVMNDDTDNTPKVEWLYKQDLKYDLKTDKEKSLFLARAGFTGIKYPAQYLSGGREDKASNYVIFNENDIKVKDWHAKNAEGIDLFQTQQELMAEASSFESWQELQEFYESYGLNDDENNVVPSDADSAYYMNVWELAHNISPTTAEREQIELEMRKQQDKYEAEVEKRDPVTLDNIFMAELKAGKGRLETFLAAINEALSTDAEELRADARDENEAAQADALIELQKRIKGDLKHGTWLSNAQRLAGGKGITDETKKRMLTLIRNNVRQYRALYADIMNEPKFAVKKSENTDVVELAEAGVSYADMSIEERGKLAGKIRDEKVAKQIEDGTLVMGKEFQHYLDSLEAKEKKHARDLEKLKQETKEDYNRITSKVERDILKKYEELQGIREQMEFKKIPVPKELDKGIAKAKGYTGDRSALSQNYNRIWKEYDDLLKSIEVTAKFKERLAKVDAMREAKAEMRIYREEKETAGKIRDMQKKLVKRTMRKVSFNNVDYDNARTIIAIQDILEPNLFAGVNTWLGVEKAWARDIWSGWKTDDDYRKEVIAKLDQTETGRDLLKLLADTKTEQQFILWKDADKNRLERMLATKDWKKELKLLDLKKERAGAIQLDVTYKETKRNVYNAQGDYVGEEVFNIAEVSDELAGEIEEKIGTELYENIIHKPWEEWTIGEVEDLAKVIDDLYRSGRDALKARRLAEKLASAEMREKIAAQVATTNVVINDDDSDEVKEKKQKKINKILGVSSGIQGTSEAKARKDNFLNRLLHGYHDANVRRVARILDGWKEGTNTKLLYWKENDCYIREERSKNARTGKVEKALAEAGVKLEELYNKVKIEGWTDENGKPHELTIDEILFFAQADRNNNLYKAEQKELGIDEKDAEEESSYKAVVYGNLMDENEKEKYRKIDDEMIAGDEQREAQYNAAIEAGDKEKAAEFARLDASKYDAYGNLILDGKTAMMTECKNRMNAIMAAYNNLDEKYKAVQDAIAEDYDKSFERMNRASIEEFNLPVWREKWYLPLIRLGVTGDTHEARVRADLLGNSAGTGAAGVSKGFTKKRIDIDEYYQRPVETGLYSTWADSVERTEHFIAYSGYVRELNRVYMNRDAQGTMQNIKNRYGAEMTAYIQEYIHEVANPKNGTPKSAFDRFIRNLRGNCAPAYLSWKFSSILKQALSSPAPYLQFVNPFEYANAAKDFALNAAKVREAISQKSVYMKNRKFDPLVDLIAEQKAKNTNSKVKSLLNDFNTTGMQGLEWIDYMCVAPGWLAVYRKENKRLNKIQEELFKQKFEELKNENEALSYDDRRSDAELETQARAETTDMIEELSVQKADDATRLCQPSNRKVDIAPMFKNSSEVAKALLQFQTALNVIWNNIRYDIPYAVKNRQFNNIVGMVGGYVMAGIMLGLVTEGFDDDDDEAQKAKKSLYWSMTQFTDSMPVIGSEVTSAASRLITGDKGFLSSSSIFASFDKYKDAVVSGAEGKYEKAAGRFANGIALTLGLPASGAKEIGRVFGIGDGDGDLSFNPEAFIGRTPEKPKKEKESKKKKKSK